jgi:hypothetical protein
VIEGSAGYGRGLTVALSRRGEWVIEFDRPTRKSKDGAKSDALDAIRAAREMLGRKRLSVPRAHDGIREAIRVRAVTRAGAVRVRTAAINELKALIVTADDGLRAELRGLRSSGQVAACAKFRDRPRSAVHEQATRVAMRSLAQRVQLLDAEIAAHDRALRELIDHAAPQLVAERGIGYITAAAFYLAWSHPGRCHSEAAFADSAALHRSPPPPARTRPDIASTVAATASSTGRSTSSPSPSSAATHQPAPTSPVESLRARPNARPSAASSASSPGASGDSSSTRQSPLDKHRSITSDTDKGASDAPRHAGSGTLGGSQRGTASMSFAVEGARSRD